MRKIIYISLLISAFLFFSCNKTSNIRKSEILSDDEFISILIDLHKADGIIISSEIRKKQSQKDSVSLYNYVLKKHSVSRLKFSKTVQYYSIHIEEYNQFYDSVNNYFIYQQKKIKKDFEIEQEKLKEDRKKQKDSTNLWPIKETWELPDDGKTNPIAFKIYVSEHGIYTLNASIRIFQDDRSVNQRMTIIANYEDGSKDLNTVGSMIKDGRFETYEVTVNTNKNKILNSVSGWILDHSKGTKFKHASVKNIKLKHLKEEKSK